MDDPVYTQAVFQDRPADIPPPSGRQTSRALTLASNDPRRNNLLGPGPNDPVAQPPDTSTPRNHGNQTVAAAGGGFLTASTYPESWRSNSASDESSLYYGGHHSQGYQFDGFDSWNRLCSVCRSIHGPSGCDNPPTFPSTPSDYGSQENYMSQSQGGCSGYCLSCGSWSNDLTKNLLCKKCSRFVPLTQLPLPAPPLNPQQVDRRCATGRAGGYCFLCPY